jgi:hypothetical protein
MDSTRQSEAFNIHGLVAMGENEATQVNGGGRSASRTHTSRTRMINQIRRRDANRQAALRLLY